MQICMARWILNAAAILLFIGKSKKRLMIFNSSVKDRVVILVGGFGIIAPIVLGIGLIMRRAHRRIPFGVLVILQGALVLGAIMTGIVVPEILKKSIGTANATLLPLNYGTNLLVFYGVLIVVTAAAIGVFLRIVARRARTSN